MKLFAVPSTCE